MSRAETSQEAENRATQAEQVPRSEILNVAASAFRENLDAYNGLGYRYVIMRGDRLVSAGPTAEDAWERAKARGIQPDEAFCGSVIHGCAAHPF